MKFSILTNSLILTTTSLACFSFSFFTSSQSLYSFCFTLLKLNCLHLNYAFSTPQQWANFLNFNARKFLTTYKLCSLLLFTSISSETNAAVVYLTRDSFKYEQTKVGNSSSHGFIKGGRSNSRKKRKNLYED